MAAWGRQPQIRVLLDRTNVLGAVLDRVWLGTDISGRDFVSGTVSAPPPSGTTVKPGVGGMALVNTGTAGTSVTITAIPAYPYIQIGYGYFNSSGGNYDLSALTWSGGGTNSEVRLSSSTAMELSIRFNFGTARTLAVTTGTINSGQPVCAIVQVFSATDYRIYANGIQANGTLSPGTFPTLDKVSPPAHNINGGLWLTGYGYGRTISDADALRITRNPEGELWRIFRPIDHKAISGFAAAGIAFDAAGNSGYQAASSSYTFNRTVTGSNTFLAVDAAILSVGGSVSSIVDDYGGSNVNMTFIGGQSTVTALGRVENWGLAGAVTGTKTIQVNFSGSIASISEAVSYTGVHQTSPTESFNGAQATNVGAADATVNITPIADNTWIHSAVVTNDTSITPNQTSRNNVSQAAVGSGADEDSNGPITPAASTATSFTGVGAAQTWAIGGYAIRPLAASGGTVSGAGSITSTATVTGVGASTASVPASVTATSTETGVGASTQAAAVTSTAVLTMTGVGATSGGIVSASGSISATSTMTGVGAATQAGAGYMNGVLIATGSSVSAARRVVHGPGKGKKIRSDDDDLMELAALVMPLIASMSCRT